jgi:hypothetical protein
LVGQPKTTGAVAVLVALAVLVAGGCRTDREVTRPDPVPVTDERLTEALITDDDVPSPFTLAEDADPLGFEVVPEHECDDTIADLSPERSVTATFTGADATLENTVAWYPGQGGAVSQAYVDLLDDCKQVVVADEGLSFTVRRLDFGVLSNDTLPIVFVLEQGDGAIEERNVIVMRAGDLVSTIRLDGPRPTSPDLLDAVVRVAIGNLGLLEQDTNP